MSYIKTNWQNKPNQSTPINAANLNHIEDGIYDVSTSIGDLNNLNTTEKSDIIGAINEVNSKTIPISQGGTGATTVSGAKTNLGFSTSTSLYTNSSGTFSTITLSDSISNYKAIGIYYFWENTSEFGSKYIRFLPSNGKLTLDLVSTPSDGNGIQLAAYGITASGNTITFESYTTYRNIYISTSNPEWTEGGFSGNYTMRTPYITKVEGYK